MSSVTERADRPYAGLIAAAEMAALTEALRRFGPGEYSTSGATRRGCCVHLSVHRDGQPLARWRYELDGSIADDPRPPAYLSGD